MAISSLYNANKTAQHYIVDDKNASRFAEKNYISTINFTLDRRHHSSEMKAILWNDSIIPSAYIITKIFAGFGKILKCAKIFRMSDTINKGWIRKEVLTGWILLN